MSSDTFFESLVRPSPYFSFSAAQALSPLRGVEEVLDPAAGPLPLPNEAAALAPLALAVAAAGSVPLFLPMVVPK